MSQLLLATKEVLVSKFNFNPNQCDCTIGGSPYPTSSEMFVSIHGGEVVNSGGLQGQSSPYLDMMYGLYVTVSVRFPQAPFDKLPTILLKDRSLDSNTLTHQIAVCLHCNYEVITRANNAVPSDVVNKFQEPLRYFRTANQKPQTGEWWMLQEDSPTFAGFSQTMTFGNARCIKPEPDYEDERTL